MSPGSPRRRALVLGATGTVGQRLVARLLQHPWFELAGVAGSGRSAGKPYGEVTRWLEEQPLSAETAARTVLPAEPSAALALLPGGVDVVFSALDAEAARLLEPAWVAAGTPVFSNASAFRADPQTPLLVPEVNGAHLDLVAERVHRFELAVEIMPFGPTAEHVIAAAFEQARIAAAGVDRRRRASLAFAQRLENRSRPPVEVRIDDVHVEASSRWLALWRELSPE